MWDTVKRKLDDMVKTAIGKAPNRARLLTDVTQQLRAELDRQVPEYADARASAQAEILARNAFKEGSDFLTKGDIYETQQALARLATLAPQAVETFRQGFLHAYATLVSRKPTAGNLLAQVKDTPDATQRMTVALGQGTVQRLTRQRADEEIMQRGLEAVTGQSQTARFLTRQALQVGGAGVSGAALGLSADELFGIGHKLSTGLGGAAVLAATQALTRRPGLGVDERVAERIAQMLDLARPGAAAAARYPGAATAGLATSTARPG